MNHLIAHPQEDELGLVENKQAEKDLPNNFLEF